MNTTRLVSMLPDCIWYPWYQGISIEPLHNLATRYGYKLRGWLQFERVTRGMTTWHLGFERVQSEGYGYIWSLSIHAGIIAMHAIGPFSLRRADRA